jgi:hypothetical protein
MTSVELLDPAPLAVGSRARIKQPLQRAKVWTVDVLEPETSFYWSTTWLGVTMSASHDLEATTTGTTNTLSVDFEGRGARLMGLLLGRPVQRAIAKENHGLKSTVETRCASIDFVDH